MLFLKKIDNSFSQKLCDSNTHLMSIKFKLKVSMCENYPFPCSDFTFIASFWIKRLSIFFKNNIFILIRAVKKFTARKRIVFYCCQTIKLD